jgi:site-specific recombinase XerD
MGTRAARPVDIDQQMDLPVYGGIMGHRSITNTVVYTAVDDKRIRNIWGK